MLRTLEEMADDESLCKYCAYTEYGIYPSSYITPNGYVSCEGAYCEDAYSCYVDDYEDGNDINCNESME